MHRLDGPGTGDYPLAHQRSLTAPRLATADWPVLHCSAAVLAL